MTETLKSQRGRIKVQLTRAKTYVDELDKDYINSKTVINLKVRLSKLETALNEFNDIQTKIECLTKDEDEFDLVTEEKERYDFEDAYYELVSLYQLIISQFEQSKNATVPHMFPNLQFQSIGEGNSLPSLPLTSTNESINSIKLPTISLPKFGGEYKDWIKFRDSFAGLVHDNKALRDIQKLYYLRSCLTGKALHIVDSLKVSASNYAIAWQMLVERYEQKGLIIHSRIRELYEYPRLNKESHTEIRDLYDTFIKNLRSLKALDEPTEYWDSLIIFLITTKLDPITNRQWELFEKKEEVPTLDNMSKFLDQWCRALEKIDYKNDTKMNKSNNSHVKKHSHDYATSTAANNSKLTCYFCNKPHFIYQYQEFLNLNLNERSEAIRKNKLCYNCLRPNHRTHECKHSNCKKCGKRHNTLLHVENHVSNAAVLAINEDSNNSNTAQDKKEILQEVTEVSLQCYNSMQVLLSTAVVKVKDAGGELHSCRVLLDSGSMSCFITKDLCKKMDLTTYNTNHSIKGVGQSTINVDLYTNITLHSCHSNYQTTIACLVLEKITEKLPTSFFNKDAIKIPANIKLADPGFNKSGTIDLLLGSTIFWQLICDGQFKLYPTQLIAQKTKLGWVIAGGMSDCHQIDSLSYIAINTENEYSALDNLLARFWQIEETGREVKRSRVEEMCEQHLINNYKHDRNGRFIVKIPFKENINKLGRSKRLAIQRFFMLEKKLTKFPLIKKEYAYFMSEYERLGFMSEINESEYDKAGYYLPHHCVIREFSETTKLRVVFDASMKTDTGLSLNDYQLVGPRIQNELFALLLRFRKHNFVMAADISKMFLMVLLDPEQRKFQKILWRSDASKELKCYELNTVSFGMAASPWLAIRSLYQLGIDCENINPKVSKIIKQDFYVDDLLTGCDSKTELLQLQKGISKILHNGGFELRKWLTNDQCLQKQFLINNNLEVSTLTIGENKTKKMLGVHWNANRDEILYSMSIENNNKIVTKRVVLSMICQIYDPLGLLGPIIIVAKIIIQKLWQAKISWDEALPQNLYNEWLQFQKDLPLINNIKLTRQVVIPNYCYIELYVFADASESAYGASIYIRSCNKSKIYKSRLLTAKSRVAPIKQLSLPRLALCAALLAAQLTQKCIESIEINFDRVYYWSDSTIVLCWLKGEPIQWKTFVGNRVSEIQILTNIDSWHHANSQDNPADLISRGLNGSSLVANEFWWKGPKWLESNDLQMYLNSTPECKSNDILEKRILAHITIVHEFDIISKYSTFKKLQRVIAYVLRFPFNLKSKKRELNHLTSNELENAVVVILKLAQKQSFSEEYNLLLQSNPVGRKSPLLCLDPFMDERGLIRLGGRIQQSNCNYDKKHPIILSSKHIITKLILRDEHQKLLHCGPTMLLASIRERFWPIAGLNLAKHIVRSCVKCFKASPTNTPQYLMGNLPSYRVNQCFPIFNTGCDFAGPFLLRDRNTRLARGAKLIKAYVCLFICMATKAIHIKLVSEMTTESFLAALKRFISRRGKPLNIYTDNGSNFIGANVKL